MGWSRYLWPSITMRSFVHEWRRRSSNPYLVTIASWLLLLSCPITLDHWHDHFNALYLFSKEKVSVEEQRSFEALGRPGLHGLACRRECQPEKESWGSCYLFIGVLKTVSVQRLFLKYEYQFLNGVITPRVMEWGLSLLWIMAFALPWHFTGIEEYWQRLTLCMIILELFLIFEVFYFFWNCFWGFLALRTIL